MLQLLFFFKKNQFRIFSSFNKNKMKEKNRVEKLEYLIDIVYHIAVWRP